VVNDTRGLLVLDRDGRIDWTASVRVDHRSGRQPGRDSFSWLEREVEPKGDLQSVGCGSTAADPKWRFNTEGQARYKASPAPSCWPSALNPSWKATAPCGECPSNDSAKKTSCGTPSSTSPGMFMKPNFL